MFSLVFSYSLYELEKMFRILLLAFAFVKSTEETFWEKVMADNKVFYHMLLI